MPAPTSCDWSRRDHTTSRLVPEPRCRRDASLVGRPAVDGARAPHRLGRARAAHRSLPALPRSTRPRSRRPPPCSSAAGSRARSAGSGSRCSRPRWRRPLPRRPRPYAGGTFVPQPHAAADSAGTPQPYGHGRCPALRLRRHAALRRRGADVRQPRAGPGRGRGVRRDRRRPAWWRYRQRAQADPDRARLRPERLVRRPPDHGRARRRGGDVDLRDGGRAPRVDRQQGLTTVLAGGDVRGRRRDVQRAGELLVEQLPVDRLVDHRHLPDGEPERTPASRASAGFLLLLGIFPVVGVALLVFGIRGLVVGSSSIGSGLRRLRS